MKKILLTLLALSVYFNALSYNEIDRIIEQKAKQENLTLSPLCDDATFIRRATLTITGRLPLWQKTEEFTASRDTKKREKLIKELLASEPYVDYQIMKWGDLFRIKSEFPSNIWPNAVQAYNRWIREYIAPNVSYDKMVYDLLTSSGSNFRSPGVNFFRAFQDRDPKLIADNVSVLFTGVRTAPDQYQEFFTQLKYKNTNEWKEEIVYVDLDHRPTSMQITMPDGEIIKLKQGVDYRQLFASWLCSPTNDLFAKSMANRVWYWLMGRGIIDPVDDISQQNTASNPELLAYLEKEFITSGFDLKKLFYLILSSDAFSRSSISECDKEKGAKYFAYYPTIRLNSEQLLDAINDVTGVFDTYISRVPEPYSYFPSDIRAVQLGDGTVTSAAIELFGRPSRDVSMESDRNNDLNSKQVLYLLNSAKILQKINSSDKIKLLLEEKLTREDLIKRIYLIMLSREASAEETKQIIAVCASTRNDKTFVGDLIWALINSSEFLFNH
ncbi:MAG: DUF1553 domain-containing protein [Rikenellaceae bacterium]